MGTFKFQGWGQHRVSTNGSEGDLNGVDHDRIAFERVDVEPSTYKVAPED